MKENDRYGEAQSAESRQDFVHKVKICLKELRETNVWLKIIRYSLFTVCSQKVLLGYGVWLSVW